MKNVVKSSKHFFGYFNTLETHSVQCYDLICCFFQMAPSIYMATAVEVVRRRAFSEQYLKKATSIADTFCTLHDEELSLRMNFQVMNICICILLNL